MRLPILFSILVSLAAASSLPADAGLDIDFGAKVRVGDDTDLFFAISSRYFERDRATVEHWGRRYASPDDLAVALFISRHSGRSLDFVFSLRRGGTSWWDVGAHCGVPVDLWFVPVDRDPGPPYGKAYGYWKKHKRDSRHAVLLSDDDVRNLVAVRLLHDYYGVPVEIAMSYRSGGTDVRHLASVEYQRRHGHGGGDAHPSSHGKAGKGRKGGRGGKKPK